jgi:predicted nucleic acid-binding protein
MKVVADTSPLNYLVQIDCPLILPHLFGRVSIPKAVLIELQHPTAPLAVRSFANGLPDWVSVREAPVALNPALAGLHPGEREAIQLALEENADLLLIDERAGARLASQHGLKVIGTLGVLVRAADVSLINIDAALNRLRATDFRCTPELFEHSRRLVSRNPS